MNELEAMFRRSMRALTSAVSIISTAYESRNFGMTVTSVTSVSMSPPSLLTCINKTASLHGSLIRCAQFYVNLVHAYSAFSRKPAERLFLNGKWNLDLHGLPYLLGAQANICDMDRSLRLWQSYHSPWPRPRHSMRSGQSAALSEWQICVCGEEAVDPALRLGEILLS
jgi:flavin reductase (DIM6/NTAB) family NADH-FMN oxidoreductase RutF